jgi:uncharacterized caspase-like protein
MRLLKPPARKTMLVELLKGTPMRRAKMWPAAAGLLFVFILNATLATAERRVALVIGNSDYMAAGRLVNPANDAEDMKKALERLGFDVTLRLNLKSAAFARTIAEFGKTKAPNSDLALLFYAGHGVQYEKVSYLVPVDANPESPFAVKRELYSLPELLDTLRTAPVSVVILDACRNNLLLRSRGRSFTTRGLAPLKKSESRNLVIYATKENEVADDGKGRNSPFTKALLQHIETPGLEIATLLKFVKLDVMKATGDAQRPTWTPNFDVVVRLKPAKPLAAETPAFGPGGGEAAKRFQEQLEQAVRKALQERLSGDSARLSADIRRREAELDRQRKALAEKTRQFEEKVKLISAKEAQIKRDQDRMEAENRQKAEEINELMARSKKYAAEQKKSAELEIARKRRALEEKTARLEAARRADAERRKEDAEHIELIKEELRRRKHQLEEQEAAIESNADGASAGDAAGYKPRLSPDRPSQPPRSKMEQAAKTTSVIKQEKQRQSRASGPRRRRKRVKHSRPSKHAMRVRRRSHNRVRRRSDDRDGGSRVMMSAPPQ